MVTGWRTGQRATWSGATWDWWGGTGKKTWLPGHGHLDLVALLCQGRCPWRG